MASDQSDVLRGTLDLLILKTLTNPYFVSMEKDAKGPSLWRRLVG